MEATSCNQPGAATTAVILWPCGIMASHLSDLKAVKEVVGAGFFWVTLKPPDTKLFLDLYHAVLSFFGDFENLDKAV